MQDELAALDEPPKLVTLHPAAVKHDLAAIDILAEAIKAGDAFGAESKAAMRDLVARMTVQPAEVGTAPEISIEGHVTKLIGGDHFSTRKVAWGESGSGRGT